jgi:hypothetical protein
MLVAITAVALPLAAAAPAQAESGQGAATQYTAAYSMDFTGGTAPGYTGPADLGYWNCSGVRVDNNHFVRDNWTCSTTATDVTATFSDSVPWPCGCSGWSSDFDGRIATSYEVSISGGVVNGWALYG